MGVRGLVGVRGVRAIAGGGLLAVVLGGCGAETANRWNPESAIHAAVYRQSERALRREIAANPQSINLIASYSGWWGPLSRGFYNDTPLDLAGELQWRAGENILLDAGAKSKYELNPHLYRRR